MSDTPAPAPLTPDDLQAMLDLPTGTVDRLRLYMDLLGTWQARINLVGRGSLGDAWRRHVLDSAQLHRLLPPAARTLVDLGSGAGFPGLVIAILGGPTVHLVESDARKCVFLREVIRQTDADAVVHNARAEAIPALAAEVVTARALAALPKLLEYAAPFLAPGGCCLFLKGRDAERELTESAKTWKMTVQRIPSLSDPSGMILRLEGISRHARQER